MSSGMANQHPAHPGIRLPRSSEMALCSVTTFEIWFVRCCHLLVNLGIYLNKPTHNTFHVKFLPNEIEKKLVLMTIFFL